MKTKFIEGRNEIQKEYIYLSPWVLFLARKTKQNKQQQINLENSPQGDSHYQK